MILPEHRIVDLPHSRPEPWGVRGRMDWMRSQEMYCYFDAEGAEVLQARFYDPSCLLTVGPFRNGTMGVSEWGGRRPTCGVFPQCVDCLYAGRYVLPSSQVKTSGQIYYNATAVCLQHLPHYTLGVASALEWVTDPQGSLDRWLVFPAKGWELDAPPR